MNAFGGEQPCLEINFPDAVIPYFSAREGTTSRLEALDSELMFWRRIQLEDGQEEWQVVDTNFEPWSPARYRLTTHEGIVYIIHAVNGLESITDLEGNSVTYQRDRIEHSSGLRIDLTRDSQGRSAAPAIPTAATSTTATTSAATSSPSPTASARPCATATTTITT